MYVQYGFFIFDTDQALIYSAVKPHRRKVIACKKDVKPLRSVLFCETETYIRFARGTTNATG